MSEKRGMSKEEKIIGIVVSALLAIAALFGWFFPIKVPVEPLAVERIGIFDVDGRGFTGWNSSDLTIYSDAGSTQRLSIDGATGLVTSAGGLTLSDGDAVIADDLRVTAQTGITVTNGAAFTPTGTYQPIQAASEVTPTIGVGTAGDLVVLINTGTQTVNLADTGTAKLSAAWAAGQYDSLILWCDGTNWVEISRSNN